MASPYAIDKVNRTTAGPAFTRRGRTCATRKPPAPYADYVRAGRISLSMARS